MSQTMSGHHEDRRRIGQTFGMLAGVVAALAATLQFDDPVNIQFTSGTTGSPKGVTLTHHNILNNGYFTGRAIRLTPEDRI